MGEVWTVSTARQTVKHSGTIWDCRRGAVNGGARRPIASTSVVHSDRAWSGSTTTENQKVAALCDWELGCCGASCFRQLGGGGGGGVGESSTSASLGHGLRGDAVCWKLLAKVMLGIEGRHAGPFPTGFAQQVLEQTLIAALPCRAVRAGQCWLKHEDSSTKTTPEIEA